MNDVQTLATLDKVIDAYGGRERWATASRIEAVMDAGGPLFRWKRGTAGRWRDLHMVADVHEPRIRFTGFDQGRDGVLEGHSVWLEDGGAVVARRRQARDRFPGGWRVVHWDALDMMYFLGYALWNYLAFPALLMRDDITWSQDEPNVLRAQFPRHLATHCPVQRFHFDPATSLLIQHDYTADVFGRSWAHACHLTSHYRFSDGVPYTARRRVMPRNPRTGRPMARPALIWADIHSYELHVSRPIPEAL